MHDWKYLTDSQKIDRLLNRVEALEDKIGITLKNKLEEVEPQEVPAEITEMAEAKEDNTAKTEDEAVQEEK